MSFCLTQWSRLVCFHEICLKNAPCVCHRLYSSKPPPEVLPPSTVRKYAVKKYVGYMERYGVRLEKIGDHLEQKYPKVYKLYKLVKEGMRDFFTDAKMYLQVGPAIWAGRSLSTFSRVELENYRQIPSDMLRVAPVLLVAALPFGSNISFPIAYFFPRHLLCRHFWTPEQRLEFGEYYLKKRLHHHRHIIAYLYKFTDRKDVLPDEATRKCLKEMLDGLYQGKYPSPEQILALENLFGSVPFGLSYISKLHRIQLWHLAKSMDFSTRRRKLEQSVLLLHNIDVAIHREGIASLNLEDLQQACFSRGFNAVGMDRAAMENYMHSWTHLSRSVNNSNLAVLLYAPVLLTYSSSLPDGTGSEDSEQS